MPLPDENIQRLLKSVADHFDQEDKAVRERQIRTWRRLKYYWNGFQKVYWSEVAHDWKVFDQNALASDEQQAYYDKPVNVFKAYLESIIAALSISVPSVRCAPDDADNPLDLSTAKAGNKISELVYKHNDVVLLWIHALYIYCTEGMIASYNYTKEDESYGTYKVKETEDVLQEQYICSICGAQLPDDILTQEEKFEFDPGFDDIELHDRIINDQQIVCSTCGASIDSDLQKSQLVVERIVGESTKPKSRQCIEVFGGLYVKVPNYAISQKDIPYLIFSYETHFSNVVDMYPHLRDKFTGTTRVSRSGTYDSYERWGRLSTQYNGEMPINTITVRNCWIRPSGFNVLPEEDAKLLRTKFPDGAKVVLVNDNFADACNQNLDDHWTLTKNPLSDYIHSDPLGLVLTSMQDITNDLVSLVLQTIEHGIPQTFADPSVLNFDQYRQTEVSPGDIFPAKPASGKSVKDAFYEVKTATLSGEVLPFAQKIQEYSQLVSGALPSLFGGATSAGSQTASEYSMSRAQAQQRLQTPYKMLLIWWKEIFSKVVPAYIKNVVEDERHVERAPTGDYINVFIRKAELQGKIGAIELEASEQLPITWAQKKDVIMELFKSGNDFILSALGSPENIPLVKSAIGLDEFVIPGEDDRQKQNEEIQLLLQSEPIANPMPSPDGQEQEFSSVPIDPELDNHQLEADICRRWLISETGRLAKLENPTGYKNVLIHMKEHLAIVAEMMAQQQMAAQGQEQKGKVPDEKGPPQSVDENLPIQ